MLIVSSNFYFGHLVVSLQNSIFDLAKFFFYLFDLYNLRCFYYLKHSLTSEETLFDFSWVETFLFMIMMRPDNFILLRLTTLNIIMENLH